MDPKVSVIIPVFNVENYLEDCLDSVVGQTLQEIEIICINDGSTDNSLHILQRYAQTDSRIILIDKPNEGYGKGVNDGMDMASGKYIGIVEPDDFIKPDMYEVLYLAAEENALDFVKSDFYRFETGNAGKYLMTRAALTSDPKAYNCVFNPSADPDCLLYDMHTWTGIYRRSFLVEHAIRHNTTPGAAYQDTGFWFQTFIYGRRAMLLDQAFYQKRKDNPGSSVNDPKKIYTIWKEFDFIREILARDSVIWNQFKYAYWRAKYYGYMMRLNRIAASLRPEYIRRMQAEFRQGIQAGEIDLTGFPAGDRRILQSLLDSTLKFHLLLLRNRVAMKIRKRVCA